MAAFSSLPWDDVQFFLISGSKADRADLDAPPEIAETGFFSDKSIVLERL
jgi:hypothetical protein